MMNREKNSLCLCLGAALITSSLGFPARAETGVMQPGANVSGGGEYVKDSYIVTFKAPLVEPPNKANRGKVPFGEHTTGQSKAALAQTLGLKGEIVSIFETINAVHVKMDYNEALRLSRDGRVLSIDQDKIGTVFLQTNPGWALDRLDEASPVLDNTYNDTPNNGAGRTIYILDSGLTLTTPAVAAEFGGRAAVIYDVNGGAGTDCNGHGTMVSSAAAGNIHGVAKGATIRMAKVTNGCTDGFYTSTAVAAFNWLAANEARGTIVNFSLGLSYNEPLPCNSSLTFFDIPLENSIKAAFNAGIIVVVAAGNDGCNTKDYSPTNIAESFVVGATSNNRLSLVPARDAKSTNSRTGWNISTFAPGGNVRLMNQNGVAVTDSGTSFSAPYIAGVFAVACQANAPACDTSATADLYAGLRNAGTLNTVTNPDGTALTGATSRFIYKAW